MKDSKCKICRRLGIKLFLRGEKCLSQKCPMIRKPYPPGPKTKRRTRALSEYGKELKEKQKLKNWYNLEERQLRKYVKEILKARGKVVDAESALIKILESRLDNVVFRLGFAPSRTAARQMVSHRHFMINNKPINIPGYLVKKDDKISINPGSAKKIIFQKLPTLLKKHNPPSWLKLDTKNLEGKVIVSPNLEEAAPPAELSSIFAFYSK
ncbi:MAG: 30S ribosomal protein S4 [bacterium]|nr:30S ribosomal protein S4 [bacterium]